MLTVRVVVSAECLLSNFLSFLKFPLSRSYFYPCCLKNMFLCCFYNDRQRKKPESGSIRRAFRQSDSHGLPSSLGEPTPPGAIASARPSSQPIMSQSLPKDAPVPDACSISGHGSLNSLSRHASLKNRIDSPHIRKNVTAGRSKSFNNHRPMDPEVIAQVMKF